MSWGEGGGRVGSLQATPPAAGGGREVRGRGMAGTCERERECAHVVWGVGIGQCCIYSASAVCT